jgi:selenocysteine lyase/cysteine desulfurase
MNLVATGMRLEPGDEILTTTHEHPGGLNGWQHMEQMQDVVVNKIDLPVPAKSKAEILERVEDGITARTRVCSFSHITTTTGLIMPMAEIAEITRPRDILLVCDGAQAPGMLDVDVHQLGVDAYASSSHKWMLAPKGSGLLYVRREAQDRIRPVSAHAGMRGSRYAAYSGAVGTRNTPMLLAHGDTMDFHDALGRGRVEARTRALTAHLRQRLAEIPKLTCVTPDDPELSAAMTSYTVGGMATVGGLFSGLKERHINVKQTGYSSVVMGLQIPVPNVRVMRLSTHIYNSDSQIDRLAEAIEEIV